MTKIPVVIYAESTPNPATMKFVANILLAENGVTVEYNEPEQAKASPIAQKLFEFPFVKAVFIAGNFITVAKTDAVNWNDIAMPVREFIRDYLSDGKAVFTEQLVSENQFSDTEIKTDFDHAEPKTEIDQKIIDVLEEYVKPAVAQDGGAIFFQSFDSGKVTLALKGSCSGCPSATFTLKAGVEGLLKRMVPEVTEVVAEEL
jgi:NFU1 iron-sulfur cluster scaffold homolog, mitochondrial